MFGRHIDYELVHDACGICRTDIHQVNNDWITSMYPMVPRHKITGTVSEVGAKVTQYKVGDRVAVGNLVDSCRKCGPCHKGHVNDDGKISSLRFVLDPRTLFQQGKRQGHEKTG